MLCVFLMITKLNIASKNCPRNRTNSVWKVSGWFVDELAFNVANAFQYNETARSRRSANVKLHLILFAAESRFCL